MGEDCKHDGEFNFSYRLNGWYCTLCGFTLNFDPKHFEDSVAYVEGPGSRSTKTLPPLAPYRK